MDAKNNGNILVKLAKSVTARACRQWRKHLRPYQDEVLSESYVAVARAIEVYPIRTNDTNWSPSLWWATYNRLIEGLQQQNFIPRSRNDDRPILKLTNSEAVRQAHESAEARRCQSLCAVDARNEANYLLSGIPADAHYALMARMNRKHSISRISRDLGTTRYYVQKMIDDAIRIIKRKVRNED